METKSFDLPIIDCDNNVISLGDIIVKNGTKYKVLGFCQSLLSTKKPYTDGISVRKIKEWLETYLDRSQVREFRRANEN